MLRPACHTGAVSDEDDLDGRLAVAGARLAALGIALEDGGPWPLADRFDHAPEASWGPHENLAHMAEMLPYWLGEADRVLAGTADPVPFGRVATDGVRLANITRERTRPIPELVTLVQAGIDRWRLWLAELDEAGRSRRGVHATLGEMAVTDIATRFAVGHLENHLDQLAASLDAGPARA